MVPISCKASQGKREKARGQEEVDPVKEKAKLRKTVLAKVSCGEAGTGRRLAISPVVRETMKSKYPARRQDMPATVVRGTALDSLPCLKEKLLKLKPGKSGGSGGMKNEFLRCASQNWDERELGALEEFGLMYLNVSLKTANSCSCIPCNGHTYKWLVSLPPW